jgi:MFS family permease
MSCGPDSPAPAEFQRATTLRDRTYIGLLIAQFLAAFNDQAIHASAMFFAINKKVLTQESAISLMPILFYAPWAIFCTLAGYYADRYSKRSSLVLWKFIEVGITGLALTGFIIGSELNRPNIGVAIVLSTVFLMGLHSTFFVPAKYGAMPEILRSDLLSRANGLLESLSFLAVILGTVIGGLLSYYFNDDEYVIGIVITVLALIGAGASLLIRYIPPANPDRPYPAYIYGPLFRNLRVFFRSRPLAFALVGIAFFTFMVAFMRAAVYMLGESRIPRWNELQTSGIVGMTALGIFLGSPLAGWLSGRKVELGLIPIGGIGMILVMCVAAMALNSLSGLITCIILIGFFTGFYLVPMFTQLQHRAPKEMKGEVVATSNFFNVIGAISASLLFFGLVGLAHTFRVAPRIEPVDVYVDYELEELQYDKHHRPALVQLLDEDLVAYSIFDPLRVTTVPPLVDWEDEEINTTNLQIMLSKRAEVAWNIRHDALQGGRPVPPIRVTVSRYVIFDKNQNRNIPHYHVRLYEFPYRNFQPEPEPPPKIHDNRELPRYLFIGAAVMTLGVLGLLINMLRDLLERARWVLRSLGRGRPSVDGIQHLPGHGPVILATNALTPDEIDNVRFSSDRRVHFLSAGSDIKKAANWLHHGHVVGVTVTPADTATFDKLRSEYQDGFTLLPVLCGEGHVRFGDPLKKGSPDAEVIEAIRNTRKVEDH